jgi:hypothetical protein
LFTGHASDDVMTHMTVSPSTGICRSVGLFVPVTIPLTLHSKTGLLPPFTGLAVNTTTVPSHTGFAELVIDTLGGTTGFTLVKIVFDWAGFPVPQLNEEVSWQFTKSPFDGT